MSLLKELSVETGLALDDLELIILTAPRRYKEYDIPKKSGGFRRIAHPSRELKLLQRCIAKIYLCKLPTHASAMAYVRKRNILENATSHAGNPVIVKLDFKDFFHSILPRDLVSVIKEHCDLLSINDAKVILLNQILFWGRGTSSPRCLSIGAPTSSMVSNIVTFKFDMRMSKLAAHTGVVFTRYADDITISGRDSNILKRFAKSIELEKNRMKSPRLTFNYTKCGLYSKGMRQMVTGLILTPDGKISLGRDRKRLISAMIHKFSLGNLGALEIDVLKGYLGFSIANEPGFVDRLRRKYGGSILDKALREPNSRQRSAED